VQTDVERVLWAEEIPQNVHVSGHVYDIGTGLVTTIVDAKAGSKEPAEAGSLTSQDLIIRRLRTMAGCGTRGADLERR
jgi:hypothetical protein